MEQIAPRETSETLDRRRLVVFAIPAFLIASCLALFFGNVVRAHMDVPDWSEYLAENERASLVGAMGGAPAPSPEDPALHIPGFSVVAADRILIGGTAAGVFEILLDPEGVAADSPVDAIRDYWAGLGMEIEIDDGGRVGCTRPETGEFFLATRIEKPAGERAVWRVTRALLKAGTERSAPAEWPEDRRGLLPEVPPGGDFMELGAPGRPGYTLLVNLHAEPGITFSTLVADLLGRGWSPLLGDKNYPGRGTNRVFRHESAPLGCHLSVRRGPKRSGLTRVFISLF